MTPISPCAIATNPTGASWFASAEESGLADAEASEVGDVVGSAIVPSSVEERFASATIARTTTPAITRKSAVGELFFTGATGFGAPELCLGAGVVETRVGTGGISIFAAELRATFAALFFAGAFLAGRFADFLALFLTLFLAPLGRFAAAFFTGRLPDLGAAFLAGRFALFFAVFLAATC